MNFHGPAEQLYGVLRRSRAKIGFALPNYLRRWRRERLRNGNYYYYFFIKFFFSRRLSAATGFSVVAEDYIEQSSKKKKIIKPLI